MELVSKSNDGEMKMSDECYDNFLQCHQSSSLSSSLINTDALWTDSSRRQIPRTNNTNNNNNNNSSMNDNNILDTTTINDHHRHHYDVLVRTWRKTDQRSANVTKLGICHVDEDFPTIINIEESKMRIIHRLNLSNNQNYVYYKDIPIMNTIKPSLLLSSSLSSDDKNLNGNNNIQRNDIPHKTTSTPATATTTKITRSKELDNVSKSHIHGNVATSPPRRPPPSLLSSTGSCINNDTNCIDTSLSDWLATCPTLETIWLDQFDDIELVESLFTSIIQNRTIVCMKVSALIVTCDCLIQLLDHSKSLKHFIMFGNSPQNIILLSNPTSDIYKLTKTIVCNLQTLELFLPVDFRKRIRKNNTTTATTTQQQTAPESGSNRSDKTYTTTDDGSILAFDDNFIVPLLQSIRLFQQYPPNNNSNVTNQDHIKLRRAFFQCLDWESTFELASLSSSSSKLNHKNENKNTTTISTNSTNNCSLVVIEKVSLCANSLKSGKTISGIYEPVNKILSELIHHPKRLKVLTICMPSYNDNSNMIDTTLCHLINYACPKTIHLHGFTFDQDFIIRIWTTLVYKNSNNKTIITSSSSSHLQQQQQQQQINNNHHHNNNNVRHLKFSFCTFNIDMTTQAAVRLFQTPFESLSSLILNENTCYWLRNNGMDLPGNDNRDGSESVLSSNLSFLEIMVLQSVRHKTKKFKHLRYTDFSNDGLEVLFYELTTSTSSLETLDIGSMWPDKYHDNKFDLLCQWIPKFNRRLKYLKFNLFDVDISNDLVMATKQNYHIEQINIWETQSVLSHCRRLTNNVQQLHNICDRNKLIKLWIKSLQIVPDSYWSHLLYALSYIPDNNDKYNTIFRQLLLMDNK